MPIQLFQIFLDKQSEPYQAGEQVKGKFVVEVINEYKHNGVYLKFEGHAIIKWTEASNCFEHTLAKQHRARKQFFQTIFKYAHETSEDLLPEGTHIFPFEYTLPPNLPSSLSTPTVTIWYKIEAIINKEPKPRREVLVFPVQGKLDLNTIREGGNLPNKRINLDAGVSLTKGKSMLGIFTVCFCDSHYVSARMKLGRQGYLPGDQITCELAVLTKSMHLNFVSLSLIQEITVITKEKTMIERRAVVKLTLPDLYPGESDDYRRWEHVLSVPKDIIITSNTDEYPDVKINYFVKFCAEGTKFPYKDLNLVIPVAIGTTPLVTKMEAVSQTGQAILDYDNDHNSSHTVLPVQPERLAVANYNKKYPDDEIDYSLYHKQLPRIVVHVDVDKSRLVGVTISSDHDGEDKSEFLSISPCTSGGTVVTVPKSPTKEIDKNAEISGRGSAVIDSCASSPKVRKAFEAFETSQIKKKSANSNDNETMMEDSPGQASRLDKRTEPINFGISSL